MPYWSIKNVAESHTHKIFVGRESVIERLSEVKALVISYDLWMSLKTEEIFSCMAHYCTSRERKNNHIGMLSTTATDGVSLYFSVMKVVDNFSVEAKIVGITSDCGGNLWVCREALEPKYTNDSVSPPPKILFTMECLVHILTGACKVGVKSIKSDDGEVDTVLTRHNMHK